MFRCWDHFQGRLKHPAVDVCILMRAFEKKRADKLFVVRENGGWSKWRNYKRRNLNLLLTKCWLEHQKERRHFRATGVVGRMP